MVNLKEEQKMKYMLLIYHEDQSWATLTEADIEYFLDLIMSYIDVRLPDLSSLGMAKRVPRSSSQAFKRTG